MHKELGDVLAIHADAGDVAAQKAIAAAIRREWGGLDVAFFNAGIGDLRPLETRPRTSPSEIRRPVSERRVLLALALRLRSAPADGRARMALRIG